MALSDPVDNVPSVTIVTRMSDYRGIGDYSVGSSGAAERGRRLLSRFLDRDIWSEPGSRSGFGRGGKSGLHMAAGSVIHFGGCRRRGDPTESATENIPLAYARRAQTSKGEKAGQEPTVPGGDIGMQGKPPAEQDQVREESRTDFVRPGARRPVSPDFRVGRLDKWLPLLRENGGKTEFGLSAHSYQCFAASEGGI